jgi:hypothetical protein
VLRLLLTGAVGETLPGSDEAGLELPPAGGADW